MKKFPYRMLTFCVLCIFMITVKGIVPVQAAAKTTIRVTANDIKTKTKQKALAKKIHQSLMAGKATNVIYDNDVLGKADLFDIIEKNYSYGCLPSSKNSYTDCYYEKNNPLYYEDLKMVIIDKSNAQKYRKEVLARKAGVKAASSEPSDALAQEIHDTMMQKKAVSFYVKGGLKSYATKLNAKLEAINKQGVVVPYYNYYGSDDNDKQIYWHYDKIPGTNVYKVTFDEWRANAYYYAIQISEQLLEYCKSEYGKPYTYASYNGFGELSDYDKLCIISNACVLSNGGTSYVKANMKYDTTEANWAYTMKDLATGNAVGQCMHYAYLEEILFQYWGIRVYKCYGNNHEWVEGIAKDYTGVLRDFKFDYRIIDAQYFKPADPRDIYGDGTDDEEGEEQVDDGWGW